MAVRRGCQGLMKRQARRARLLDELADLLAECIGEGAYVTIVGSGGPLNIAGIHMLTCITQANNTPEVKKQARDALDDIEKRVREAIERSRG